MSVKRTNQPITSLYGGVGSAIQAAAGTHTTRYEDDYGREEWFPTPLYMGVDHDDSSPSQDRASISVRRKSTRYGRTIPEGLARAFPAVRSTGRLAVAKGKPEVISRILPANTERVPFSLDASDIGLYLNGIIKLSATVARWRFNHA